MIDIEIIKLYIATINNALMAKSRGLVLDEENYLHLQDMRKTVRLYNAVCRKSMVAILKELDDEVKPDTVEQETDEDQGSPIE